MKKGVMDMLDEPLNTIKFYLKTELQKDILQRKHTPPINIINRVGRNKIFRTKQAGYMYDDSIDTTEYPYFNKMNYKIFSEDKEEGIGLERKINNSLISIIVANTLTNVEFGKRYGLEKYPIIALNENMKEFNDQLFNTYLSTNPILREFLIIQRGYSRKRESEGNELDLIVTNVQTDNRRIYADLSVMKTKYLGGSFRHNLRHATIQDIILGNTEPAEQFRNELISEYNQLDLKLTRYTDIFKKDPIKNKIILITPTHD